VEGEPCRTLLLCHRGMMLVTPSAGAFAPIRVRGNRFSGGVSVVPLFFLSIFSVPLSKGLETGKFWRAWSLRDRALDVGD